MTLRGAGWGLMAFLALGVALYAAIAYSLLPLGAAVHPDMRAAFQAHPVGIGVHVFASILALALGPFQFSSRLRARHLNLHRWMGRLYLGLGVLVGGLAGLYLAQFAYGGLAGKLGRLCVEPTLLRPRVALQRELGQDRLAAERPVGAALRDLDRIGQRFREVGEQLDHLLGALERVGAAGAAPVVVAYVSASGDAQQGVVRLGVLG